MKHYLRFISLLFIAITIASCGDEPLPLSKEQSSFTELIQSYSDQYDDAQNSIQKTSLHLERKDGFKMLLGKERQFYGWVVRLTNMGTDKKGNVDYLNFAMTNDIDLRSTVEISPSRTVYRSLTSISEDSLVVISGMILAGDDDYLKENSLTEAGSMASPTFRIYINDIRPYESPRDIDEAISYGKGQYTEAPAGDQQEIQISGSIFYEENKLFFEGKTNLPIGTKIGVTVKDESMKFGAQDYNIFVKEDQTFKTGGFSNHKNRIRGNIELTVLVIQNSAWQTSTISNKLGSYIMEPFDGLLPGRKYERKIKTKME